MHVSFELAFLVSIVAGFVGAMSGMGGGVVLVPALGSPSPTTVIRTETAPARPAYWQVIQSVSTVLSSARVTGRLSGYSRWRNPTSFSRT
jgi:uncharacterized membrane protein YfcA